MDPLTRKKFSFNPVQCTFACVVSNLVSPTGACVILQIDTVSGILRSSSVGECRLISMIRKVSVIGCFNVLFELVATKFVEMLFKGGI